MANHGEAPIRRLEINLILPKGLEGKSLTKRDGVLQAKADRNIVWLIKAVHPGSYLVRVKVCDATAISAAVHVLKATGVYGGAGMSLTNLPVSEKEIEIEVKKKEAGLR